MFDLLRPYVTIVRLWILIVVLTVAVGYVAYLHNRIREFEQELAFMKQAVEMCSRERSRLRSIAQVQEHNITALTRYYSARKCLELKDGELSDEEMSLE
jgi:predicted Holliday junction resolvase-like endonuclease